MLLRRFICFFVLLVTGYLSSFSQGKTLQAIKIDHPPVIDGKLDDACWATASTATGFIQNFPNVNTPSTQRTVVSIAYDNSAIYVGAYLYDDPKLIRKQITARDEEGSKDLDYFSVFFDTYNDKQNGFQFLVTSSNVQTDARLGQNLELDFGQYGDKTWDAIWDSKVSINNDGWSVEMKIPYISLRFAKKDSQDWGVQFLRSIRRKNETAFWNPVDPQVNGFVNQFGHFNNLVDIKPPLRLSLSPYLSTGARRVPEADGYRTEWLKSGGMDIKYGLNESFTLDATLIPDFGQVISDNVVNNLTPYEVRFDENRPFFTEGTEIFNKSGLFYSRRIGATPNGYNSIKELAATNPNIEIVNNPGRTQLYNAVKFSGRTKGKLGIGLFNAIGAPMYATIRDKTTGEKQKLKTEVLTNYNIFVLDQALRGRSYITLTNTNVTREGNAKDANVTGLDFSLYNKKNIFNIKGYGHYSKIFSITPYDGYNTNLQLGKVSGKIRYSVSNTIRSADYDPRDLGFLQVANKNINIASISYNQYNPTKTFLTSIYTLQGTYQRVYEPDAFNEGTVQASAFWYFKNFWDVNLAVGYTPDQHDYYVIGAPFTKFARRPQYAFATLEGSTDSRKRLFVNYELIGGYFIKNSEKEYYLASGGARYRFSNRFSLEVSHRRERETDYIINAGTTNVGDPRIAFVDFKDVTSIFAGIYNFTPRINLTLRVRHYWSNVVIKRTAELDYKGYPINESPVPSIENVNFFNADAFFTWDFRYGSRLILGYKNWLGDDQSIDGAINKHYFNNLEDSFDLMHGNEATIRFIYFLDYNQLKKKK